MNAIKSFILLCSVLFLTANGCVGDLSQLQDYRGTVDQFRSSDSEQNKTDNKGNPEVFGRSHPFAGAMKGEIFYLQEGAERLPDFNSLRPVGSVYTKTLNIPGRDFRSGFPGVTNRYEWFAIRYRGHFSVSMPGMYTFKLISDDGSRLYINGKRIIDNDGVHGASEETGQVFLNRGKHSVQVEYFQGPRYEIALQLFIKPSIGSERMFESE